MGGGEVGSFDDIGLDGSADHDVLLAAQTHDEAVIEPVGGENQGGAAGSDLGLDIIGILDTL